MKRRDSGSPNPQATFLGLPRELRDIIYESLLNEQRRAPPDPDHAGDRNLNGQAMSSSIFFDSISPKPALLQLKLCSWLVYDEVNYLLRKVTDSSGPAHLDIMVKGSCIWPTWTMLPLTPRLDPIINISLRIFETTGFGSEFSTGAYRALWSLFNLLVFHGPCLIHSNTLKQPLAVGRLRFDILLCFPAFADDVFGTYRDVFSRVERLAYDNVGLGNVATIEACLGTDRRVWRLKQLPTGLTFASRQVE